MLCCRIYACYLPIKASYLLTYHLCVKIRATVTAKPSVAPADDVTRELEPFTSQSSVTSHNDAVHCHPSIRLLKVTKYDIYSSSQIAGNGSVSTYQSSITTSVKN